MPGVYDAWHRGENSVRVVRDSRHGGCRIVPLSLNAAQQLVESDAFESCGEAGALLRRARRSSFVWRGCAWRRRRPLSRSFFFGADAASLERAVACVRARGVAVVRGALTAREVSRARQGVWQWLSEQHGCVRREPATWRGSLFSERHGVLFGAGQCAGSWRVRGAARAPCVCHTLPRENGGRF